MERAAQQILISTKDFTSLKLEETQQFQSLFSLRSGGCPQSDGYAKGLIKRSPPHLPVYHNENSCSTDHNLHKRFLLLNLKRRNNSNPFLTPQRRKPLERRICEGSYKTIPPAIT
ncbi:hypothetical protein CDAR_190381 [Caerostris darwini]|uniref:Uncharacterized protein n=1 Tax=Caerostris darwini TaxID=1538125 RepID=A0AAV4MLY3_9ARAC|nr:hypothetical protein CDAR_190381 [Caerostris darwini]